MDKIVEHIECKSAKDFLDLLSPRGKLFGKHQRRDKAWVYRGHGDDSFELVPKSLRNPERENLFKITGGSAPAGRDNLSQINAEVGALKHFIHDCNQSGLVVPGYGTGLDHTLLRHIQRIESGSEVPANWPHRDVIPALCLATTGFQPVYSTGHILHSRRRISPQPAPQICGTKAIHQSSRCGHSAFLL